jgi:hypothetical protein
LKQSGRTCWIELGNKLATLRFCRLESDWGLYVKPQTQEEDPVLILVYVDDFVIAARTTTVTQDLLKKLKGSWKLSEMGEVILQESNKQISPPNQFLGLDIQQTWYNWVSNNLEPEGECWKWRTLC